MGAAVGCFEQDFKTETQRDIAAKMLTGLVCHFKYHPGEVPPTRSSGFYVAPGQSSETTGSTPAAHSSRFISLVIK